MNKPHKITHHRKPTGKLIACDGEAHNPANGGMVDHCGVCMPRWGQKEELAPVDLDAARRLGGDVPYGQLTDAQQAEVEADEAAGLAVSVYVRATFRWGSRSYSAARYKAPKPNPRRDATAKMFAERNARNAAKTQAATRVAACGCCDGGCTCATHGEGKLCNTHRAAYLGRVAS